MPDGEKLLKPEVGVPSISIGNKFDIFSKYSYLLKVTLPFFLNPSSCLGLQLH